MRKYVLTVIKKSYFNKQVLFVEIGVDHSSVLMQFFALSMSLLVRSGLKNTNIVRVYCQNTTNSPANKDLVCQDKTRLSR